MRKKQIATYSFVWTECRTYIVISQYANAIKDIIDQGYFVVITPNGVEGGKEKDANAVVDLLDKKDKQFITITPEPQDSPKLLKHVVAKSDLIVTVEGGLMHLAYNLGKPLFALQMRGSGDFSKWLSYARSDKQKTITTGEDFAERIGERKVEEKPATEKPVVEEEPVTEIEEAAKIELEWWEGKRDYIQDEKDIARMLENGELIRLKDGGNYKISPAMKFKLATSEINSFIEQIADEWVKELENQGIKAGNKLMITNAARTTEYQKELISEGYHAAERSSHTLGVAFDVADKYFPAKWFNPLGWLKRNDKGYADPLNKMPKYQKRKAIHRVPPCDCRRISLAQRRTKQMPKPQPYDQQVFWQ